MQNWYKIIKKLSRFLEVIFGYGIMLSLFIGGISFFGYVAAFVIGGDKAGFICDFIYNGLYPKLVYFTSAIVVIGIIKMYLCGETALKSSGKK